MAFEDLKAELALLVNQMENLLEIVITSGGSAGAVRKRHGGRVKNEGVRIKN